MSMKRQVRWIYKAILKTGGVVESIDKQIAYYDSYGALRKQILEDEAAPSKLKVALPPINPPKYMKWIKEYLKNGKEQEE